MLNKEDPKVKTPRNKSVTQLKIYIRVKVSGCCGVDASNQCTKEAACRWVVGFRRVGWVVGFGWVGWVAGFGFFGLWVLVFLGCGIWTNGLWDLEINLYGASQGTPSLFALVSNLPIFQ